MHLPVHQLQRHEIVLVVEAAVIEEQAIPLQRHKTETSTSGLGYVQFIITSSFTKLPWSGDSEDTFRPSSQASPAHLSTTSGGGFALSV